MKLTPEEIEELQKRERKIYRDMAAGRSPWWEPPPPQQQERAAPKLRVIRGGKKP